MKKIFLYFTLAIVLFLGLGLVFKNKIYCMYYKVSLKQLAPNLTLDSAKNLTILERVEHKLDKKWIYLKYKGFYLPVPSKPVSVNKAQNNSTITVLGEKYSILFGQDELDIVLNQNKYLEDLNLKSVFEFNRLFYATEFMSSCNDLDSYAKLKSKLKLAVLKSVGANFKLQDVFITKDENALILQGINEGTESEMKYILQVLTQFEDEHSENYLLMFQNLELREQILNFLSSSDQLPVFNKNEILEIK